MKGDKPSLTIIDDVVLVDRCLTDPLPACVLAPLPGVRVEHRPGPWHADSLYDRILKLGLERTR